MSHVTEFSISGLAGRQEVYSQKLNRDVNVFFGLNGSGKTSLLKILHSAMDNSTAILKNVPFIRAEVKVYSTKYEKEFTHTINQIQDDRKKIDISALTSGLVDIDDAVRNELLQYSNSLQWSTKPKVPNDSGRRQRDSFGGWQHRYLPTSRLYLGTRTAYTTSGSASQSRLLSEEQLDLYFARSLEELWYRYSADILSAVRKAQEDGLASILKAILSTEDRKESSQQVESEIAYERVAAFLRRQGSPGILDAIK